MIHCNFNWLTEALRQICSSLAQLFSMVIDELIMKPVKLFSMLPEVSDPNGNGGAAISPYETTETFINTVTNFNYKANPHHQIHHKRKHIGVGVHRSMFSRRGDLTNFVKIYFDFTYYLLACPFRVVLDHHRGKFVVRRWRLQQVCCAVMQFLCLIRLATEVRQYLEQGQRCKSTNKNPVQYFQIILRVASFIYKTVTMKRMWLNQREYVNVLNLIRGKPQFAPTGSFLKALQSQLVVNLFFLVASAQAFASLFVGKSFIDASSLWTPSLWSNQLTKLGRYTFFAAPSFQRGNSTVLSDVTAMDGFRAFVMALCLISRYIHGIFADVFILSFTMTLWSVSKSFSDTIIEMTEEVDLNEADLIKWSEKKGRKVTNASLVSTHCWTWPEVYRHFREIQQLSTVINIALGGQVTSYMAEAVMYYSVHLNLFLSSSDIFVRIDLFFFYFTTFGILFVSADVCRQIEAIKLWIAHGDNRKQIPADDFSLIMHEMVVKDIGIRGNTNMFTVTYSLLAMFFSTIVTYFIICVQQSNNEAPPGVDNTSLDGNGTILCI